MKTTTASGSSRATCEVESWPQSTKVVLEIAVPRCGSRTTSTPCGARRRASSVSSGVASESPVTSKVSSGCFGGVGAPTWAGSNASGVTGGTPRLACGELVAVAKPPPRSEEHTSELQSHSDLVCRLLLEKKKHANSYDSTANHQIQNN